MNILVSLGSRDGGFEFFIQNHSQENFIHYFHLETFNIEDRQETDRLQYKIYVKMSNFDITSFHHGNFLLKISLAGQCPLVSI